MTMEHKTDKTKKACKACKKNGQDAPKHIGLVKNDGYLEPFENAIKGRHDHAVWKINQLTRNGKKTLEDFASGYDYYGLHKMKRGWVFREWAPNATAIYLVGDFNNWQETDKYKATRIEGTGNWELKIPEKGMKHGDLFKMHVYWNGGSGERIPAWAQRVVQDDTTKIFSAQVWNPEQPYTWKKKSFKPNKNPLLIYECHIGMGQDAEKVGTYTEFKENVLPRVVADGYNCIQIMAIQEHPYYGSFGYHVSSFFAASSRFGTPEELKALIDEAHRQGVAVIMDIVHSHAVKNEMEGLGNLADKSLSEILQILSSTTIDRITEIFDLIKNNSKISASFKAEIAENILSEAINNTEENENPEVQKLEFDAFCIIVESNWTRASSLINSYFMTSKTAFESSKMKDSQFVKIIEGVSQLATAEVSQVLTNYLTELNKQTEKGGKVSETIILALVKSLGELGNKNAFDQLLLATYLDYPQTVIAEARISLTKLKWEN